ncbi:MAG: arsenic resistance N-acetyltransferase ArsN2 [Candidatus Thorarchaeota archaeon]
MKQDLHIEQAHKKDLPPIRVLLQETDLPIEGIDEHIGNFLVIRSPEAVAGPEILIGCVGLEVYGSNALLRSLAVHPHRQGEGLGTQLVSHVTDLARKKGVTRLFLLTDTAEAFFRHLGYVVISRDKVPKPLLASIEFTKLCPSSPCLMREI